MKVISTSSPPRIPLAAGGIQVNFCKNPRCANFGVPASAQKQPKGRGNKATDTYLLSSSTKTKGEGDGEVTRQVPTLVCQKCGEQLPIKSNQGVLEEKERILAYLAPPKLPGCPHPGCPNHTVGIDARKGHYRLHSTTHSGSRRYLCLSCRRTFSVGKATLQQRAAHLNNFIFKMLVNKVPLRRICEIAGISPRTLYRKFEFLYAQCRAFAGVMERALLDGTVRPERLYVSVDRQDHTLNWTRRRDKRNTIFHAVGSADNRSSYVFGVHLNFDASLDRRATELEAEALGDPELRPPFRRHARLWLDSELPEALRIREEEREGLPAGPPPSMGLLGEILDTYREAEARGDVEVYDRPAESQKLPVRGMQVHAEYTLYGHFAFLHELFAHVGKVRFFLDQESGIRAACLAAFRQEISERRCDAFYVRIDKGCTNDEREGLLRELTRRLDALRLRYPYDISDTSLRRLLVAESIKDGRPLGPWKDLWIDVPSAHKGEPRKKVCHLTDHRDYDDDHLAALLDKASLHGIDRFFAQVRSLLAPMERPPRSAANNGRVWYKYNLYRPDLHEKLLEIFRVHYNYVKKGEDGRTPAMRLGLATHVVRPGEIVNFQPFTQEPVRPQSKRSTVIPRS